MALFGLHPMSELSPLSGAKRKLDFGAVRAAFDPNATSTRRGPSHPAYDGSFRFSTSPHPCRIRLRYLVEDRHGHFGGRAWRGER
jgi:hypothetical protein